jgi:ABC-type Fe3+-siderophore transport system permease subunit
MWNTEILSSITLGATATVPIVVALTQIVKMTGYVKDKYMPFMAILMGILISFLFAHDSGDWSANILAGILFGLAGSGLYSGLKASAHAFQVEKIEKRNIDKQQKK